MQLNPSEISELIQKKIEGFEATSEARTEPMSSCIIGKDYS